MVWEVQDTYICTLDMLIFTNEIEMHGYLFIQIFFLRFPESRIFLTMNRFQNQALQDCI